MKAFPQPGRGFTLIELLVTLALIVVLASLVLSALSRAKEQARRIKCVSNLKQIAFSTKTFGLDHDGKVPWHTPVSEGGTYGKLAATAWTNFSALSNDLVSPQLLVCPSDAATKKIAWEWGEFLTAPFSSNALSFFVGLDGYEQMPFAMLAGDRNITGGKSDACGSVANSPGVNAREYKAGNTLVRWTNAIHGLSGDIALTDGSVQRLRKAELQELVDTSYRMLVNGSILSANNRKVSNHILPPR
jgi:prepilin-type N-terminal cleavage/methylation domain-containing protein